jgi:hypothetical protein
MPGRHQAVAAIRRRRPRLRWLVAVGTGAAIAAAALGFSSVTAGASGDPVNATFGVTGVATSNCPVSVGGTDVYVTPGQELDVKSSLAGIYVAGYGLLSDLVGSIASLDGKLVIDPGTDHAVRFGISTTTHKITGLTKGNHHWKWTAKSVTLLKGLLGSGITVPLSLTSDAAKAGAKLTWTGTIHVTSDAAKCGVAVALPSVSASVSVTGLPPIAVGIPGVKVSVPVGAPSVPNLPGGGGNGGGGGDQGGSGSSSAPELGNPIPVPAEIVPGANGGGLLGGGAGGYSIGDLGSGSSLNGSGAGRAAATGGAGNTRLDQNSTGPHKTIDLAASRPSSTGEVWVVLAIVAVIALAFVAATYARLYLMKRES